MRSSICTGVLGGVLPFSSASPTPPFATSSSTSRPFVILPTTVYSGGRGCRRTRGRTGCRSRPARCPGHRDGAARVVRALEVLLGEGVAGTAGAGPGGVAALEHRQPALGEPVAGRVVEVVLRGQGDEALAGARRSLGVEGEHHGALVGLHRRRELAGHLGGRGRRRHRAARGLARRVGAGTRGGRRGRRTRRQRVGGIVPAAPRGEDGHRPHDGEHGDGAGDHGVALLALGRLGGAAGRLPLGPQPGQLLLAPAAGHASSSCCCSSSGSARRGV